MDKIQKFLHKLTKKERGLFTAIFGDVATLRLAGYDIKQLKGYAGLFRLRKGKIRIVFAKINGKGVVLNIAFRKDIYK